jgi:DUF4097 and DUF4098 domain-containing protein YvlB
MAGIKQLKVDTSFGEVKIIGSDTTECSVAARITGSAPTKEEARQLAEDTQIKLEPEGGTLVVKVEKPQVKNNRNVGVSFDITIPTKTAIKCETSYGDVELKNISGDVAAKTSFGKIRAENISGKIRLDTSYGEVDCEQITTGDFFAKSSFGKMDIDFADACPAELKAKIETSYGQIDLHPPKSFAGDITVETSFGKIKTDLPITVKGDLGKDRLRGTIGQPALSGVEGGAGSLDLKTSFGNVEIK